MQQMQYGGGGGGGGGYSNMSMTGGYHINMNPHPHHLSMGRMMNMPMNPRMNMGMMSSGGGGGPNGMSGMSNLPIRAGGPSINMRMPMDPHGRMYGGQGGRPSPYPNPSMYMAQKRHQSPMAAYNGAGGMGGPPGGPMGGGGQYIGRGGPYPPGSGGGYPMGHPHNMGGGPGPGFSGMAPGMHPANMASSGGMVPNSSMSPMTSMSQNYPSSGMAMNGMRPSGSGGGGPYPPAGGGGGPAGVGGLRSPGSGGMFRPKTEIPTVSPRGGGSGGGGPAATASSFQHSPVPGNPTPPLTPNGPGGHCVSAPFASPSSEHGGSIPDSKQNFSLASKFKVVLACKLNINNCHSDCLS